MASSRRAFFRQAAAASAAFFLAGCDFSLEDDPDPPGIVNAGSIAKILDTIDRQSGAPYYISEAKAYVSPFPDDAVDAARAVYPEEIVPLLEAGFVVLDQKCTHLGCRTPFCNSSQWFECPCHGAKFNRVGEKRAGPAPRGLDLVPATVIDGNLVVETARILEGVPVGTNTTGQRQEGPSCL